VVICISGFLTEDVDKRESWRHAINHFKYSEVYALNWTSLSVGNMFTEGYFEGKTFKKTRYFMFLKTGRKQFTWAQSQTKLAGTLLALFLLKTDFA
jgi:hypothetical protein